MQAKLASKICIQNKENNEATMNQKAKVAFLFFLLFDQNQPMTQPSAGKKERHTIAEKIDNLFIALIWNHCNCTGLSSCIKRDFPQRKRISALLDSLMKKASR